MANINEIVLQTRFLLDGDSSNMPVAASTDPLVIALNHAYETVVGWILQADGRWQYDDNNFTTFPIATTTLVASQKDYTFDATQLRVLAVEVMDKNGKYYPLKPLDRTDIKDKNFSITEYQSTAGQPAEYDLDGGSIVLYPAPDNGVSVTLAAGLKLYFQRTADVFTVAQIATGTKLPGFASTFHMILAYMSAVPFAMKHKPERVQGFETKVAQMRGELDKFYARRDKDETPTMSMAWSKKK